MLVGTFPCYLFVKFIARRTTSFYNKEAIFFAEGVVKFQMHVVYWLNVELFMFQLILQTVRLF